MNIENLRRLREQLRSISDEQFYMADWIVGVTEAGNRSRGFAFSPNCGTAGCMAGWAAMLEHPEINDVKSMAKQLRAENGDSGGLASEFDSSYRTFLFWGQRWLGITKRSAEALFSPDEDTVNVEVENFLQDPERDQLFRHEKVTRTMAIKMLDRLALQAVVNENDWFEVWRDEVLVNHKVQEKLPNSQE